MGKTRAVVEHLKRAKTELTLVLCPKSVISVWPLEIKKWGLDVRVLPLLKGTVATKSDELREALRRLKPLVVVVNYESAWREPLRTLLLEWRWDALVLDEIHRCKAPDRSACAANFVRKIDASKRIGMSGTMIPNNCVDVFAQFRALDPSTMPRTLTQFRALYVERHNPSIPQMITGFKNQDDLRERIKRLEHRVKKDDVLDLPPAVHVTVPIELPADARRVYREMKDEFIADIEGGVVVASNAMVKALRLRQIAAGHATTDEGDSVDVHNAKREWLKEFLLDLDPSEPVVVFCAFHKSLDQAVGAAYAAGARPFSELSGRVSDTIRFACWEPEPGEVLAVQWQAGGVGIDLAASATCVVFDPTWSGGDYQQAMARQDRHGQTRSVTIYHLECVGTIDGLVTLALDDKEAATRMLLEGAV